MSDSEVWVTVAPVEVFSVVLPEGSCMGRHLVTAIYDTLEAARDTAINLEIVTGLRARVERHAVICADR